MRVVDAAREPGIVDLALQLPNDEDQAWAITGLAAGFACLPTEQRHRIVDAACGFAQGCDRGRRPGLTVALPHLTASRRGQVLAAAIGVEDEEDRAWAIGKLATGLASFDDDQRDRLVTAGTRIRHARAKAAALGGLGVGWKRMAMAA